MDVAVFLVSVTAILATSHADSAPGQIGLLRSRSPAGGVNCRSWRLAVETNNLQKWTSVPQECKDYVARYMLGKGYPQDCEAATAAALEYAKSLKLAGDGKDVWVFDIDQTALSLLPYYTQPNVAFG
ncbi:hypothetical protein RJ639_003543 [Escallonia herrerae]|uniref:Acid phosphatase n=1 Tax=Escallonia herrerae TaxID=1293975 RepID=A0AA89B1J7_9ASTE|nr:hypothetical protein RJ639_003543 [Escallonia herrerae]